MIQIAGGIVDTDCIHIEVIAASADNIVNLVIACNDLRGVLTVGIQFNLHNRNLIQCIGLIAVYSHPFTVNMCHTIVVVHNMIPNLVACFVKDLNNDHAGLVISQRDDIKAGAVEVKGSHTGNAGSDCHFLGGTHGVLAHACISCIITVVIISIQGSGDLACAGTILVLGCVDSGTNRGPLTYAVCSLAGIREGQETIFVVDSGCRNDGDGGVHTLGVQGAVIALVGIVVAHGLVVEFSRLSELHTIDLIQGEADGGLILHLGSTQNIVIDHDIRRSTHSTILIGTLVNLNAGRSGVADADNTGGQGIVGGNIDDYIQTVVHNHSIRYQLRFPLYSESNSGIGIVEVSGGLGNSVLGIALMADVLTCSGRIGAIIIKAFTGLGVEHLGGLLISDRVRTFNDEVVLVFLLSLVNADLVVSLIIIQAVYLGNLSRCQQVLGQHILGAFQLVPVHVNGDGIGDIDRLGEGDNLTCAVYRLTGLVDQVEGVGHLSTHPGHTRHGELLLALLAVEVLIGNGGILVGIVSTGLNLVGSILLAGRVVQIDEVFQSQFGSVQLLGLPGQELVTVGVHLVIEVGAVDTGDGSAGLGHMAAGFAAGNAVNCMALQFASGSKGEVLQHGGVSHTVVVLVQLVTQNLHVELTHTGLVSGDILGQGEVHGVLGSDLILHHNVGSSLADGSSDAFKHVGQDVGLRIDICQSEVVGGGVGRGGRNDFTGSIVLTGHMLQNVCLGGIGINTNTNSINGNRVLLGLQQIGVILGQIILGNGTVAVEPGVLTHAASVTHDRVKLAISVKIAIAAGATVTGKDSNHIFSFTVDHQVVHLLGSYVVAGAAAVVFTSIIAGIEGNGILCGLQSLLGGDIGALQILVNSDIFAVIIGAESPDLYVDVGVILAILVIIDQSFQHRLDGCIGIINVFGMVHGGGHVHHDDNVGGNAAAVGYTGHGQLHLGDTGLGEVALSNSGLVEADSALIGIFGEVIGTVAGNHIHGVGSGNNNSILADRLTILIQIVDSYIEGAEAGSGEGEDTGSGINGSNRGVGNSPSQEIILQVTQIITLGELSIVLLDNGPQGIGVSSFHALQGNGSGDGLIGGSLINSHGIAQLNGIIRSLGGDGDGFFQSGSGFALGVGVGDLHLCGTLGTGEVDGTVSIDGLDDSVAALHDGVGVGTVSGSAGGHACADGSGQGIVDVVQHIVGLNANIGNDDLGGAEGLALVGDGHGILAGNGAVVVGSQLPLDVGVGIIQNGLCRLVGRSNHIDAGHDSGQSGISVSAVRNGESEIGSAICFHDLGVQAGGGLGDLLEEVDTVGASLICTETITTTIIQVVGGFFGSVGNSITIAGRILDNTHCSSTAMSNICTAAAGIHVLAIAVFNTVTTIISGKGPFIGRFVGGNCTVFALLRIVSHRITVAVGHQNINSVVALIVRRSLGSDQVLLAGHHRGSQLIVSLGALGDGDPVAAGGGDSAATGAAGLGGSLEDINFIRAQAGAVLEAVGIVNVIFIITAGFCQLIIGIGPTSIVILGGRENLNLTALTFQIISTVGQIKAASSSSCLPNNIGSIGGNLTALDGHSGSAHVSAAAAAAGVLHGVGAAVSIGADDQVLAAVHHGINQRIDIAIAGDGGIGSIGGIGGSAAGAGAGQLVQADICGLSGFAGPAAAVIVEVILAVSAVGSHGENRKVIVDSSNVEGVVSRTGQIETLARVAQAIALVADDGTSRGAGDGPFGQCDSGGQGGAGDGNSLAAEGAVIVHQGNRIIIANDDILLTGFNGGDQFVSIATTGITGDIGGIGIGIIVAGVIVTAAAALGFSEGLDGRLASGQAQHCRAVDVGISGVTASSHALGLQVVQAAGIVALDDDLVLVNLKGGHGQAVISTAVGITHITAVHVGEVQGLAAGTTVHAHAVALLQIDSAAAQIVIIATGVVVTEQEDDVQAFCTGLIQHIENGGSILSSGTVGSMQRLVSNDEDGLGIAGLAVQIGLQAAGCAVEILVVDGIDAIVIGIMGTGFVQQTVTAGTQATIGLMVALNHDPVCCSNAGECIGNCSIHSRQMIGIGRNLASIIVAAHQNAEGTCIVLLDLRGNIGHGGAGIALLIVRTGNDDSRGSLCRKRADRHNANKHYNCQNDCEQSLHFLHKTYLLELLQVILHNQSLYAKGHTPPNYSIVPYIILLFAVNVNQCCLQFSFYINV